MTLPSPSAVLAASGRSRAASWAQEYRSKQQSAEQALAEIRSGQRVYIHPGCAAPLPRERTV